MGGGVTFDSKKKHGIACGEVVVEKVDKKQCCKCRGCKVLEMFRIVILVLDALLVGKHVRIMTRKKLGSCHGSMVKNVRKKRRHTIKIIIGGKLSRVGKLRNAIG